MYGYLFIDGPFGCYSHEDLMDVGCTDVCDEDISKTQEELCKSWTHKTASTATKKTNEALTAERVQTRKANKVRDEEDVATEAFNHEVDVSEEAKKKERKATEKAKRMPYKKKSCRKKKMNVDELEECDCCMLKYRSNKSGEEVCKCNCNHCFNLMADCRYECEYYRKDNKV